MIQNALKFDSESMPMSIRVAWQRTLSLVGGDEVDGRSVRALEHLGRLGVLGRLAVGAARASKSPYLDCPIFERVILFDTKS